MNQATTPVLVEKEEIEHYTFPSAEVLQDKEAQLKRKTNIERATALGNTDKFKIRIVFEDTQGLKVVETTIWAAGSENIVLKQGVHIPVHCIHEIKLL